MTGRKTACYVRRMNEVQIVISNVPPRIAKKLREDAKRLHRSLAAHVRALLEESLAREDAATRQTEQQAA